MLTINKLLFLRTRKFAAKFSVKGSRYPLETLEPEMTNVKFRDVTAVVVKIGIFRIMTAGYLLSAFRTSRRSNVPEDRDGDCLRNSISIDGVWPSRMDNTAHDHQIIWTLKFIWTIFKHSVPTLQKTLTVSFTNNISLFWYHTEHVIARSRVF